MIGLFNRGGYVLDFSSSAFDDFTKEVVGFRLTEYFGLSKGKSLVAFTEEGKESDIVKLFVALFDYYVSILLMTRRRMELLIKKSQMS